MTWDVFILDLCFLLASTVLFLFSLRRIVRYRSRTMADYTICLVYLFNCLPVLLDITLGVPKYVYWYAVFEPLMADFWICLIYNTYIFLAMLTLSLYAASVNKTVPIPQFEGSLLKPGPFHSFLSGLVILAPILMLVVQYGPGILSGYTLLNRRGISYESFYLFNQFMILSVYLVLMDFFSRQQTQMRWLLLTGFLILLVWVNGKRYAIATVLEALLYMYQVTRIDSPKKKLNLTLYLVIATVGVLLFSGYYLRSIKVNQASEYLYGSLRVDFGRDDVIKYGIDRVLLRKEPILDYPGQTFLSTFLFWVPRAIWPGKPYPHFRYLTGSILGLDIMDIPAGITPSFFEIGICNFGWLGMPIAIGILLGFCRLSDRSRDIGIRLLYLNIITVLLSQEIGIITLLVLTLILKYIAKTIHARKLLLPTEKDGNACREVQS